MKKYISIILAAVCLGFIGPVVKLIDGSIPVMTVSFFRLLTGTLFLLFILPFIDRSTFRVNANDLKNYIITGFLIAMNFSLYMLAFQFAPVSNVVLLIATFTIWLAVISYFFLNENITKYMIVCILVAFAGIFIINPLQGGFYAGNMMALASAAIYAVMYAYMRYIDKRHTIGVVFWLMLFAAVFLSPAPFIYGLGTVSWNYVWVLVLGIVSTGLAYLFLNYGLERIQAETTSIIIMTTESLVAIALSILIIGELLTLNVLIGGILIILAGIILEKKYKLTKR